jgi:hypothetical protein
MEQLDELFISVTAEDQGVLVCVQNHFPYILKEVDEFGAGQAALVDGTGTHLVGSVILREVRSEG